MVALSGTASSLFSPAATPTRLSHSGRTRGYRAWGPRWGPRRLALAAGARRLVLVVSGFSRTVVADSSIIFQSPDGRRLVTAAQARAPIALDGSLDEDVWRAAEPAAEFIQAEPHEGEPATEPTDVYRYQLSNRQSLNWS